MPEPDWPQRKVWRPKPAASSESGTPARERELADIEGGALGPCALEPGAHLVRQRRARERVVEGPAVAVEDDALAAAEPDPHLRKPGPVASSLCTASDRIWPRRVEPPASRVT